MGRGQLHGVTALQHAPRSGDRGAVESSARAKRSFGSRLGSHSKNRRPLRGCSLQQEDIMLTIDLDTARRFILGKQGLWPGRRWRGLKGTERAMRSMEYLQLDPLQIIARSQDITLHSRVLDYKPALWEDVT